MLPDNKDALKVWLVETLNPISDADPEKLANYVLALIKKDKSEDDLIELCNRDLEVFLQDQTKGFVDRLFQALRSKDYLFEGDKCAANPPQASQKLASSPDARSDRGDHNSHLTSYKSLPKRDQEQIRPKEFEQTKSRRPERRTDTDMRDRWRQERKHSKSPQARSRNDLSRERPRRKFSQVRSRATEQSPRDVASPPLRLGKRSYTRSLSKSVDPHDLEQEHGRHSSGESSGSLSPEGNNKAKRNRSNSKERREGVKRQRCIMYYERGLCELGDKCPYDHGKNPVLISNSLQNSFDYSPSSYLSHQPQPTAGGPPLLHQAVIPNISQPPPALPFPHHRLPPPHFLPQPGNALLLPQPPMRPMLPYGMPPTHRPPPPIYPYMHVPTGDLQQEVYQPGAMPAIEPYMPEPYTSKPSRFSLPPPPIQGQTTLLKGAWKEGEGELEGSVAPLRQVSNLVHVSIEEGKLGENEPAGSCDQQYEVTAPGEGCIPPYTPTPSSVLMARKRTANAAGMDLPVITPGPLSVTVQPDTVVTEDAKLMPPPSSYVKKAAIEHPGIASRNQQASNSTLELRKIPREDNTIANINDHFSKFGIIVNLQVNWDNDPCAALVSYASSAQASAAYRSKEPFLNNRFIKIFWHNPEKSQQQGGGQSQVSNQDLRGSDKDFKPKPKYFPQRHQLHLNRIKKPEEAKKYPDEGSTEKSDDDGSKVTQETSQSDDQQKGTPESPHPITIPPRSALKLQRKPMKEMQKAGALRKEMELRQKMQDFFKKLLETQKNLVELHSKSKNAEEKAKYSQLLKENDAKILELREDLNRPPQNPNSSPAEVYKKPSYQNQRNKYSKNNKLVRTTSNSGVCSEHEKQDAQKAILDGELDMMASKNKEADVLKKKINDIKSAINNINKDGDFQTEDGAPASSYPPFGKFGYPQSSAKGGRVFANASRSVDRRPRQVLITGFPVTEDKTTLLSHMKNFGQVEKSLYDDKTPFFLVTYRYRSDAERAMRDGAVYGDMKLKLNWHNSEPKQTAQSKPQGLPSSSSSSFSSSSSSTHINLGLVENKGSDHPEHSGFGTSTSNMDVRSANEAGSSPTAGGGDSYIDEELNEYRRWGDVDEDTLLYEEEDEDEDDDEGVRPWRRR